MIGNEMSDTHRGLLVRSFYILQRAEALFEAKLYTDATLRARAELNEIRDLLADMRKEGIGQ